MLLAAAFFIGTLVVYSTFISPEIDRVSQLRGELMASQAMRDTQKAATNDVQALVTKIDAQGDVRKTIDLALPVGADMTEGLHQLNGMIGVSRVTLTNFQITPTTPEASKEPLVKRLGKLNVTMEVMGNYEGIRGFISLLETNVRVMNIQSFDIGTDMNMPIAGQYASKIVGEMYYQEN